MSFRSVGNKSLIHLFTWLSFRTYTRNPSLRSWVEILPPCGRQNDSFRGRLPYVIPSEAGNPLSFRTETYGRVWGISSFYFPCNSSDCTLALSEILRCFTPQKDSNAISIPKTPFLYLLYRCLFPEVQVFQRIDWPIFFCGNQTFILLHLKIFW